MLRRLLLTLFAVVAVLPAAGAQDYPTHPITVVVPFPAGDPLNFLIRTIQPKVEAALGQPLIIENKPGATGNIGNAFVAKSDPDGYTLGMTATNIGVFPHIFPQMAYDPLKDFAVVSGVADTPIVCATNSASKYQTFADLLNEAKAHPGEVNFGSSGAGAPSHLVVELIAKLNKVKFTHVPYRGPVPMLTDLAGNFVAFGCTAISGLMPLMQDNKIRLLAIATTTRSPAIPNVPTIKELGFGDINEGTRFILLAPAKTPAPILQRLTAATQAALADPGVKDAFAKLGFNAMLNPPAEVQAMIQEQYNLWGPIVKELNLKLD